MDMAVDLAVDREVEPNWGLPRVVHRCRSQRSKRTSLEGRGATRDRAASRPVEPTQGEGPANLEGD